MAARILVVDDNLVNLKLACELLETDGHFVKRAANADEALAILHTATIDLILMDVQLPGTDGLTLTRLLKADKATKTIPVVALTAFAMKGDDQRALEAGCAGYISKPFDTRTFSSRVMKFLLKPEGKPA